MVTKLSQLAIELEAAKTLEADRKAHLSAAIAELRAFEDRVAKHRSALAQIRDHIATVKARITEDLG